MTLRLPSLAACFVLLFAGPADGTRLRLIWDHADAGAAHDQHDDVDASGLLTVSDSLHVLRAAVGLAACDPMVGDVDSTASEPNTSDALRLLHAAVGLPLTLVCPTDRSRA